MKPATLNTMLKWARKRLYQRTRKLLPKHGRETAAVVRAKGFITPQLAILIGVAAVIAGLTIWAYSERAGRLACEVERVQLRDAYQVLAGKVQEQNAAITDLQRRGQAAMAQGRAALNAANVEAAKRQAEVDYWQERAARPTPAEATCATAWAEIRQRLAMPPAVKP